jgi:HK97 family phage prohead protease
MPQISYKQLPAYGFKVLDEEKGIVEAFVAVFDNVDQANERIKFGAFKASLEQKLPKAAWGHDWKQPIGKTLEAREVPAGDPSLPPSIKHLGGLYIKGQLNLGTQRGREAYSDLTFGSVDEFSIGYGTQESASAKDGATDLITLKLFEWSPVLVGCNEATSLVSIKDMKTKDAPVAHFKGQYLGEKIESNLTYWMLSDLLNALGWCFWDILCSSGSDEATKVQRVGEASDEFKAIAMKAVQALLAADATKESIEKAFGDISTKAFEIDLKAGKKFSKANKSLIEEHCSTMKAQVEKLEKMVEDAATDDTDEEKALPTPETKGANIGVDIILDETQLGELAVLLG